ncbi:MAG: isoleucine--tRNA ligase [Candidatus Cloacimonetes bacterium]|nr:isoleucine--tRNA ligase [Candidatus Cloacimonadota bacterium]
MHRTVNPKEKPAELEKRVREYWQQHKIDQKSVDFRKECPQFVFFEGPPTANGMPGIHHVISRTIKDSICRYKTMKGYQVKRKAGWDTHGLPVEIEVEKALGLKDKKEVEEFGIENFNKKCQESVFSYEKEWKQMTRLMGYWIDLENPYITLQNSYIESVWYILRDFFSRGLIYSGHKIVPYCPSCGTPLSSHEVAQGYEETEDPSVFIKFRCKGEPDTSFLAWTTTPWTLISNVALAVHPDETYVKVQNGNDRLILAKARLEVLEGDYEILAEFTGREMEYREYEQMFPYVKPGRKAFYIALADYVSMDEGTGIVHTAPAFGQDDYNLGMQYELPFLQPVDDAGRFTAEVTDWAGVFVKDADKDIIKKMNQEGMLYKRKQVMHSYPFCWRCNSPLIYYARSSWYIKTSDFKDKMLENNRNIKWYPPFVGEKRFGEWLANNVDWAISRDRFWGTPLNIWVCKQCGELECIGSIEELVHNGRLKNGQAVPADIELHRPYVDDVVLTCRKCQGIMERTPEVIDCWFDSGAMPFAQWHYPFENSENFDPGMYPADFISEGIDQTRGWFYSLLAIATLFTGKSSYKSVLVNDLILDKQGQKMSKSKGNTADPIELMHNHGADAIRWYLLAVSPPWIPTRFDEKGVQEIVNKFIGTLKNVYSFYVTYANIDNFNARDYNISDTKEVEIDRWIISRLNSLCAEVNTNITGYDLTKTVRAIQNFVIDELSNWYVRRCRRRYWEMSLTSDKKDAYLTLYQVLIEVCKLMAPFAPYLSEEIFVNLTGKESVHLTDYPVSNNEVIDRKLEKEMQTVINLVTLGRAARNNCQIKVRQTLRDMYVPEKVKPLIERMENLIKEEINIKNIIYISEKEDFVQYDIKANYKVLGPKYSKHMKNIAEALQEIDGNKLVNTLNQGNEFFLELQGSTFKITDEDIIITIKDRPGFVFEANKELFVALSTDLTPELIAEGLARELVNKIQFTRKEKEFDIMDRIIINYLADDEIARVLSDYSEYIRTETLTAHLHRLTDHDSSLMKWDINGREVYIRLEKESRSK